MASSNSRDYAITLLDICQDVVERVLGQEDDPTPEQIASIKRAVNMMVKAWMAKGYHLFSLKEATLFLGVGTQSYSLGATGTHCTYSYVQTTLSTAEALGSTSLGLTAFAGMSASDNIGIVLDDGTIHWTTISGAPGATTTIATGLASAAAAGNVVFTYTSKIDRPLRIASMYRRNIDTQDTPVRLIARDEYVELSNKTIQGKTIQAFYDPQMTNGVLYAWPTPDLATDVLRFWHERPLEDFDSNTDNPGFPIEWAEAICLGAASRVSQSFGMALPDRQMLKMEAEAALEDALGFDRENASVSFQPDLQ